MSDFSLSINGRSLLPRASSSFQMPPSTPANDTNTPNSSSVYISRPMLLSRPSLSAFVSNPGQTKTGKAFALEGNCASCMAAMRDAYDKMHIEHLKSEAEASGR